VEILTEARGDHLRRLVASDEFFWLDLLRPSQEEVRGLVDAIGLDPRSAERALRFGIPPELRRYRNHACLVFFGAEPEARGPARLVEVHVYVSGHWVVTVRKDECGALDRLRQDLREGEAPAEESVVARILESLAESFNDLMEPIDDAVARLEAQAAEADESEAPTRPIRKEVLERRRRLWRARRMVRRQRDYVDRAVSELEDLPGLQAAQRHEFRDVSAQMIRVSDRVDDALDRLAACLDLLNSAVSNRLNLIMERLTIVATIFLPLTFVTGFFGMNFDWLVQHIDTFAAFAVLGIGLCLGSGVGVALWVRSRLERRGATGL
jgi:magnesium transporter